MGSSHIKHTHYQRGPRESMTLIFPSSTSIGESSVISTLSAPFSPANMDAGVIAASTILVLGALVVVIVAIAAFYERRSARRRQPARRTAGSPKSSRTFSLPTWSPVSPLSSLLPTTSSSIDMHRHVRNVGSIVSMKSVTNMAHNLRRSFDALARATSRDSAQSRRSSTSSFAAPFIVECDTLNRPPRIFSLHGRSFDDVEREANDFSDFVRMSPRREHFVYQRASYVSCVPRSVSEPSTPLERGTPSMLRYTSYLEMQPSYEPDEVDEDFLSMYSESACEPDIILHAPSQRGSSILGRCATPR
ncbi:hypothetical protein BKA62DRAFT_343538 [Auriculariales sp. MPI-PUGE-AT-0066]|nr:hypothetical protein BKA62DRAFT_343538 [Auriculariales sp. MPI-PUGE-AT-0066]